MTSYLLHQLLNGIQLGSIYALIALGYTMVYGIINLINFAHADIFMVGAYIAFFAVAFYTGTAAGEVQELPPVIRIWLSIIVGYLLFDFIAGSLPFLTKPFLLLEERRRQADGSFLSRSGWAGAKGILNLFGIALVSAAAFPVFYYGTMLLFRIPWGGVSFPRHNRVCNGNLRGARSLDIQYVSDQYGRFGCFAFGVVVSGRENAHR